MLQNCKNQVYCQFRKLILNRRQKNLPLWLQSSVLLVCLLDPVVPSLFHISIIFAIFDYFWQTITNKHICHNVPETSQLTNPYHRLKLMSFHSGNWKLPSVEPLYAQAAFPLVWLKLWDKVQEAGMWTLVSTGVHWHILPVWLACPCCLLNKK